MPRNTYQVRLYGYDPAEGHEIIYKSLLNAEDAHNLWHDLYESHRLPELSDAWTIETDEEKPTWHYVLDVDQEPFLLEEYDDANAMIQASLEGLKSNRYEQINVRTHDFIGPSYSRASGPHHLGCNCTSRNPCAMSLMSTVNKRISQVIHTYLNSTLATKYP